MELTCALVVTLVSLGTATPHGYGIKGGALAKADASAAAGAYGGFGEVPLSIPNGAGYSGSYSKSSSSSFAASSASSSASSFSFSGSGPGVSGLGANGAASGGCTSGSCQSSGIQDSRGAGSTGNGQTYSGAKAAATAGAFAVAGSPYSKNGNRPCTGGDCSIGKPSACDGCDVPMTDKKCTSGQCEPASPSHSSLNQYDSNNKCASGNCQQTSQSSTSTTDNDIPAFVALGMKPTSEPNGQSYDKKSTAFAGSGGAGTVQGHEKPSTHLTAPKEGPSCTTATCDSPNTGSAYDKENLPSSYNVPIHGSYPDSPSQGNGPCTSGNCANTQPNAPHPSYQVPSAPSVSDSCVTGNCGSKIPSYSQGTSPVYVPTGSSNCGSSNCGIPSNQPTVVPSSPSKYPSYSGIPSNAPYANSGVSAGASAFAGSFSATKPIPASQKLPAYTGGFGGPKGILKPNEFNSPSSIPTSGYTPTTTVDTHYPAPCSSGNCGPVSSPPKPQYGQGKPTAPGVNYNLPSCSSGNCGPQPGQLSPHYDHIGSNKPTQPAGGFGGPAGILKPNDFSTPINAPVYNHKPTVPAGGISPTSCTSGTCGPPSSAISPQYDHSSAPSGSQYNPTAPTGTYNHVTCSSGNCGTQPSQSYQPPYSQSAPKPTAPTNGFGGPPGILKPNDYNIPHVPTSNYKPASVTYNPTSGPSPQYGHNSSPTGTQYNPTASAGAGSSVSCSSGSCGAQPSKTLSPYGQSGLNKPLAPSGTYNPVSCSSGNCEDKPNLLSAPEVTYNPASCTSGKCGPQSSQPSSQFGPSGSPTSSGAYYPTSCASGNCGSQYSGSAAGAVASASAVAYTRGFGGPPGFLKPYDDGKLGNSGTTGFSNNYSGSQLGAHHSSAPGGGVHSSYGKSLTGAGTGAQASAIAGAAASAYNGGNNVQDSYNNVGNLGSENQTGGGCKDGCGSNNGGANFGLNGSFPDRQNGFNTAGAAAKSVASAGAGSYGLGGSFASSSASAHASAGAATKGGYGRR